jgi:hypothetical protein
MPTAVPHHRVQSFRNAGFSLILDDDRVIRCDITPNTARCIIGTPFADSLRNLPEKEEDEGEDPNPEIFKMQMFGLLKSGGESGNGE